MPCFGNMRTVGTWRGGVILFATGGPLYRVPATGGTPTALETLPWKPGQRRYASVQLLPDGHHVLVTREDDPALYAASLDAPGTRKILDEGASRPGTRPGTCSTRGERVCSRGRLIRNGWRCLEPRSRSLNGPGPFPCPTAVRSSIGRKARLGLEADVV